MTGEVKVEFYCPAMKIFTVGRRLRRTDEEPMRFTAYLPAGNLVIENVTIPPTDVHPVRWPLHWMVDACQADNGDNVGNYVRCFLPEEPTRVYLLRGYSVAEEMIASVELLLADGSVGKGTVIFPDCKVPFSTSTAEPVTAHGHVVFP